MAGVLNGLAVRIGVVFLAGLVLMQVAVAAAILWPEGRPTIFRLASPSEAAAMARALEAAPPDQQRLILDALNNGSVIVHLLPRFPPDDGDPYRRPRPLASGEGPYMRYRHELEGRPFRVQVRNRAATGAVLSGRVGAAGAMRLLVQLNTGQVLVVERAPVLLQRLFARAAVIAAAAGGVLILVMLICILQVVRPARRLADAAHRLATDIDMPDLPVRGVDEVRTLSRAFNAMKHRIRHLLDERTRMLAAIAHDLRTYLTRLRLRIDLIEDEEQRTRAARDLQEMALLLDDTLTFARETAARGAGADERADVVAELRDFVRVRAETGEPVILELDAAAGPLEAACAPLALRRMLANLVDNALRYGGGARLAAGAADATVWVGVEDAGPGIPEAALARVLEPFERLEASRGRDTGGAGLGLAIVQALARSQGGSLSVENRPEGGLRAVVTLPRAAGAQP